MPFLDEPLSPLRQTGQKPIPDPNAPVAKPLFWDVEQPEPTSALQSFRAGIRLENPIVSIIDDQRAKNLDNVPDPTFKLSDFIRERGLSSMYTQLLEANNQEYAEAIVRRTMEERELRRERDASGVAGFLGSMVGGLTSPTMILPGGGLVRAIQGGWAVGRSAGAVAAAAGVGVSIDEALLQASQYERTGEETAMNIGGSILLGGLLGAGAARLMTNVEREVAYRAYNQLNDALNRSELGPEDAATAESRALSAEMRRRWKREDLSVSGTLASGIVDAISYINPNLRLITSPSAVSREVAQRLSEYSIYTKMNEYGASAAPGGAAETQLFSNYRASTGAAFEGDAIIYAEMKDAGVNMSWNEYQEAIGRALRRGDQGENEFVTKAAQVHREKLYDFWKDEAVRVGLLPEGITVEEAASYFSRMYMREKMIATDGLPDGFKARVQPWMEQRLQEIYAAHQQKTVARIAQLQQDLADLQLDPQGRLQALDDIDAGMAQMAGDFRDGFEVDQEIKRLRKEATAAKKEGDPARAEALRAEAKSMAEMAKEYRTAVNPLLRRRRIIEQGAGGADAKISKIQDQLVNLEESNLKSLQRLINKGRKFQEDLNKLGSEDDVAEKIRGLRELFNQVGEQMDAGADRIAEQIRKIDEDIAKLQEGQDGSATGVERAKQFEEYKKKVGPMRERLERFENAQRNRQLRLFSLGERLDVAESIDLTEVKRVLQEGVDDLVAQVSSVSLGRGERAARLLQRMEGLSPEVVQARIAARARKIKDIERAFYTRWQIEAMGDGVDLAQASKPNFTEAAKITVEDVFDQIIGRRANTGDESPEWAISPTSGPLKERTFHIPDELIEDFLESNARMVGEHYGRKMAGQVALKDKFGDVTMKTQLGEIEADYKALKESVAKAKDYKEALEIIGENFGMKEKMALGMKGEERSIQGLQTWLEKEMNSDKSDIEALRDIMLSRYQPKAHASDWGQIMRAANMFNYIRLSGRFLIASLAEFYRPAMVYGLQNWAGYMMPRLHKGLTEAGLTANQAAVGELKLAGLVYDRVLQHKAVALAELGNPWAQGTAFERFLHNLSRGATVLNGMALMQDINEAAAGTLAMNRVIQGALQRKDTRYLSFLGLDEKSGMAEKVAKQLRAHGKKLDGVWIANTKKWTNPQGKPDLVAIRAFRNAVSKDVTRTIIRPGQGDVPLLMKTPTGAAFFQFRSFMLSAHQRIMLAGLQESPARLLSGIIGMTTIGMFVSYLKALGSGQDGFERWSRQAENPGFLLGEGLDNSGIFPVFFEIANSVEKVGKTAGKSFNPIKSPLQMAFGGESGIDSQKTYGQDLLRALAGPTFGLPTEIARAAGSAINLGIGEDLSKSQGRALGGILPFQSFIGMKELIQLLNDDLPYGR